MILAWVWPAAVESDSRVRSSKVTLVCSQSDIASGASLILKENFVRDRSVDNVTWYVRLLRQSLFRY